MPGVRTRVVRPQPATAGIKSSRLVSDDVQVLLFAQLVVPAIVDLAEFTLAHRLARLADSPASERVVQGAGHANRKGKQIVAQQNTRFVVPTGVDRVQVPPQSRLVQHVVMDERGRMNHLDHRSQSRVFRRQIPAGSPRKQHQRRAKPLPPQSKTVLRQPIDERALAVQLPAHDPLGLFEWLADRCVQQPEPLRRPAGTLDSLTHQFLPDCRAGSLAPLRAVAPEAACYPPALTKWPLRPPDFSSNRT